MAAITEPDLIPKSREATGYGDSWDPIEEEDTDDEEQEYQKYADPNDPYLPDDEEDDL